MKNNKIVAVELGSANIRASYGEITPSGSLNVRGVFSRPMNGIKESMITNYDEASKCVGAILGELYSATSYKPKEIVLGLNGISLKTADSEGSITKKGDKDSAITAKDIQMAIEEAKHNLVLEANTRVLHVVPKEYKVNGSDKIISPLNMPARSLTVKVMAVIAQNDRISMFEKLFKDNGVSVESVYALPIAATSVLLNSSDKENGIVLVDIGGSTSTISAYIAGGITLLSSINLGAGSITNDLSYILGRNRAFCKDLKEESGSANPNSVNKDDMVVLKGDSEAIRFPKSELSLIISARMKEIFLLLKNKLDQVPRYGTYTAGLIIIGGGALLQGAPECARGVFSLSSQIGFPEALPNLSREFINPKYANVLGLLKQAALSSPLYKGERSSVASVSGGNKSSSGLKSFFRRLFN